MDPTTAYLLYKTIHVFGIVLTFLAFGALLLNAFGGRGKEGNPARKTTAITHGVGLFLILLGGFGMQAKTMGVGHWPAWLIVKLVIWVVLGGIIAVIYRKPAAAKWLWYVLPLLAAAAAYLALFKPF